MNSAHFAELGRLASDPDVCQSLLRRLKSTLNGRQMRFMEVCGTHTVTIFRSGLASLLPREVTHLSGPGCPVCVTDASEIALLQAVAQRPDMILATFGDLLRVPGPDGKALRQLPGASVRIVYSPLDCIALAREHPDSEIVFAAVGFETTAPAVAATVLAAARQDIANFSVISLHKLVAPAVHLLLRDDQARIDAFLLPGHVAVITGPHAFDFLGAVYHKPAAVGGFEPADILLALCRLAEQLAAGSFEVENVYQRAVAHDGNPRSRELMAQVFRPVDAQWRGLGKISDSGLAIRPELDRFDALAKFGLQFPQTTATPGCLCGAILKGLALPPACSNFGKTCQPAHPVGPCMVSTEGSCAAWFKYGAQLRD